MFKPNKTAVAGLICGLFVTSAALAQDATLPDSLTGDGSYAPNWENSADNKYALFKDQNLEGNHHNLTISVPSGNVFWTRSIAAQDQDVKFSNIGVLTIEDHSTRDDNTWNGLIYAQNSKHLSLENIGTLKVVSDKALPIHGFG